MQFEPLPLGELLTEKGYIRGPFGSALKRQELKASGVPVYEQQQAIEGHRNFRFFVDAEKFNELKRFAVKPSDLIISCSGTVGRVSVIKEGHPLGIISQALLILRPRTEVLLPRFLYYFLTSPQGQAELLNASHGAVQQNIAPRAVVEKIPTPVPSLEEQERIIGLLGALDDKIALLRETNATLEAIDQALFKSWFVDFDPVRAKAEGREPEGVPPEVADLFPSAFEDSELGEIPKGWRVSTLSEHVTAERGLSYKGAGLCGQGEGHPMHNLNSVYEGGGYKYSGIKFYSGDFKERHLAIAGDIIVANTEQGHEHRLIGFPAIIPGRHPTGLFSHHLYRVRLQAHSPLTRHSLYYMLMVPYVREQIIGCANGSTVNMLKSAGLEIPRFVCPPAELAAAFEDLAKPFHQRIEHNIQQGEELTAIRDALLPRLMSGKLRIPDAMAQIEEAA